MIKIDKYKIQYMDIHNPFTVYEEYKNTNKKTKEVSIEHRPIAYLGSLGRALRVVYERLQAESGLLQPDVELNLSEAVELMEDQMTEFKSLIGDTVQWHIK